LNERDLAVMRVFADLTADHIERGLADSKLHREIRRRIEEILEGEGLTSVYQPLVDLETGKAVGFECLSRFPAVPQQGPEAWFAEAASAGLGIDLELRAVERAFKAFDVLPEHVYLAANVSPNAILSGKLAMLLGNHPLARVVLELTEHETITEYEKIAETLRPLRAGGVRIAVDDAGAGYASFRHILRLQPDYIKLDRSLISNIQTDPALRALATAFVRFASETRSKIVAEGVETREELEALRELGVKKAQGYYFSKPLPLSAALALIAD
jgi:EAL domain-containing protein (putative c-di-GMP-specific phosphodiesterase class I)